MPYCNGARKLIPALILTLLFPHTAYAASGQLSELVFTHHWVGYFSVSIFLVAFILVVLEERLHLRKSKPVLLAAGIIWILIAVSYNSRGLSHIVEEAVRHNFLEYAELFFFLLVAMTYINAMIERDVFSALRDCDHERSVGHERHE